MSMVRTPTNNDIILIEPRTCHRSSGEQQQICCRTCRQRWCVALLFPFHRHSLRLHLERRGACDKGAERQQQAKK
jgi:hypothetical protein